MITKKELDYVNSWAKKVPYPGYDYCELAMLKLKESLELFKEKYANRKYNISFSNQEEIEFEIKHKNICHMLGIDYKNICDSYFDEFRKKVLDCDPTINISSYDMINLLVDNMYKVMEYEKNRSGKVINYYKVFIKSDIFRKLADLSNFNYGCINFDKERLIKNDPNARFVSNSTKFLYTESDENISPYFLMGLKREVDNNYTDENLEDYKEILDNSYIVETLIAPEHDKLNRFFDNQEIIIPTQILTDNNGVLSKVVASAKDKLKLLKDYKYIVSNYGLNCNLNIQNDYESILMEKEREESKILKK